QLEADRAGPDLLDQRLLARRVALAQKTKVERQAVGGFDHPVDVPFARRARRGARAVRRSGAAANHRRDAAVERFPRLLRTDEMDVRVDPASRQNTMLAGDDFRRCAEFKARRHAVLDAGVSRLADRRDAAVADADVPLHHAPVIEDDHVRDDEIRRAFPPRHLRLTLPIPHDLAAAERHLLPISREVALDLQHETGVGETHAIAGRWAIEARVLVSRNLHGVSRNLRARTSWIACSRRASSGPL